MREASEGDDQEALLGAVAAGGCSVGSLISDPILFVRWSVAAVEAVIPDSVAASRRSGPPERPSGRRGRGQGAARNPLRVPELRVALLVGSTAASPTRVDAA